MSKKNEALTKAIETLTKIDLWLKVRYVGVGLMPEELAVMQLCKDALYEQETQGRRNILYTAVYKITKEN